MKLSYVFESIKRKVSVVWYKLLPHTSQQFRHIERATENDFLSRKVEPELVLLPFLLSPGKVFCDVGANIGEYIHVARKYLDDAYIHAFEPQRYYTQRLEQFFPHIKIHKTALSNLAGEKKLKIPIIHGNSYRTRGTLESFKEQYEEKQLYESVILSTLDETIDSSQTVGCIKIDVEGHEVAVLQGAAHILSRDTPILIVEIEQRHHVKPIKEIFAWIESLGYHGYFFDTENKCFQAIQIFRNETHQREEDFKTHRYINNFVFLPKSINLPSIPQPFVVIDPIEVYSLPLHDSKNKYFDLYKDAMQKMYPRCIVKPVLESTLLLFFFKHNWRSRKHILTIHWSTTLYGSRYLLKSLFLLLANTTAIFLLKRVSQFKVIWVMHNTHAHDYPYPFIDTIGRSILLRYCDALVAQQKSTHERFQALYPNKTVVYIPHGHYIEAYGPLQSDKQALRSRFGFSLDDIVILSLGMIRPYKRLEPIIHALTVLDRKDPLKLWVVGKADPVYLSDLKNISKNSNQTICFEDVFVPDKEIPAYLGCADYCIFYYDDSELTSGALLLSLSYGTPVITRSIAGAEIVIQNKTGFIFDTDAQLKDILQNRISIKNLYSSQDIIASVSQYSWEEVARRSVALYTNLTQN